MVLCWLVEISTLMLESKKGISVAVDVIESAQGFIVLLIFAKLAKNDIRQWWHYNFCAGLQRYDSSQNTSDTSIEPIAWVIIELLIFYFYMFSILNGKCDVLIVVLVSDHKTALVFVLLYIRIS